MIKLILLDVDGTLTDGGIYYGNNGEELKKFNAKDGYAIFNVQKLGIDVGIITGRKAFLLEKRANELGIKHLYQGVKDKPKILKEIIEKTELSIDEIAYIGDDLNDYHIMSLLKCTGAPNDAVQEIKEIASYITNRKGGEGSVREFIEYILKKENKWEEFLKLI